MNENRALPHTGVLPETDPFSRVMDALRLGAQTGLFGPGGQAAAAAELAARAARIKNQARAQNQRVESQASQPNGSENEAHWWNRFTTPQEPTWTPPPPRPPVDWAVSYNGHDVGDPRVREALGKISEYLFRRVNVTSGKRDEKTNKDAGGANKSYHLTNHAADFHVPGMTDDQVDHRLKEANSPLGKLGMRVIQHGPYTATSGAHVHIDSRNKPGEQTGFQHEGMTPKERKHYTSDEQPRPPLQPGNIGPVRGPRGRR